MHDSVSYITQLYRARKALGRCPRCGNPQDVPNRVNCSKCLSYARKNYAHRAANMTIEEKVARSEKVSAAQKKRRSEGRCAICGEPSPDYYYCKACRMKYSKSKARKEAGSNE